MNVMWRAVTALFVLILLPGSLAAQDSQSEPLARQLVTLLSDRKLSAIAARDPMVQDRFVAALVYPDVQLLVVAARYAAPSLLQSDLLKRQYAQIYAALQQAAIQESKVFFQDLNADGLHADPEATVDVMYERAVKQTIFDGQPAKHRMSREAYVQAFKAADAVYSGLLRLLIAELENPTQAP